MSDQPTGRAVAPALCAMPSARDAAPAFDWPALHRAACAPYRTAGRFAWHFARGKLGRDPVFRHLAARGLLLHRARAVVAAGDEEPPIRVLDLGCGQGLLASLLAALDVVASAAIGPGASGEAASSASSIPASSPASATSPTASASASPAPLTSPAPPASPAALASPASSASRGRWRYTGIEVMPRDIERARVALDTLDPPPAFVCADMRDADFPPSDVAVVLDVLHYVDHDAQRRLLERLREALRPRGRLLLRVGDMASGPGYAASQWVDRAVTRVRGHGTPPTWGRPLADWLALLAELGYGVEAAPMSHGTPFANVLLVADLQGEADPAGDGDGSGTGAGAAVSAPPPLSPPDTIP
jgi:SAM-dependent methyltransferase